MSKKAAAAAADHHSPREEAGRFDFKDFDPKQQEAFKGMLGKLVGHALTEQKHGNLDAKAPAATDIFDALVQVQLPKERLNRAYFLHGDRGAGKSSVLVTLLAFFAEDARKRGRNETRAETFAAVPGYSEWHKSGPPILPLPILDFSSDAVSLNLPVVIGQNLARLVEALEVRHGKVGARSFEVLPSRKALDAFNQSAALVKRDLLSAPSVDHDAVLEREHSRISIVKTFSALVEALGEDFYRRYGSRPIFLFSIDDFDLTTRHLLEIISWVRELSAPGTLWFLGGDLEHLRAMLSVELQTAWPLSASEAPSQNLLAYRESIVEKSFPYAQRQRLQNAPFQLRDMPNDELGKILATWKPGGIPFRMMNELLSVIKANKRITGSHTESKAEYNTSTLYTFLRSACADAMKIELSFHRIRVYSRADLRAAYNHQRISKSLANRNTESFIVLSNLKESHTA